jgi:integrase
MSKHKNPHKRKPNEKMQRLMLTDEFVSNLPIKRHDYTVWDKQVGGFGIRVYHSGVKSYHTVYKKDGRPLRRRIGFSTDMSCEAARKIAFKRWEVSTIPSKRVPCLQDFIRDVWIPHHDIRVKPSSKRSRSARLQHILPVFGDKQMDKITRAELTRWFDKLSFTQPVTANKSLNIIGQVFNFAITQGVMERNPARDIRRNKEQKRTRFLSHQEVEHLFATMNAYVEADPSPSHYQQRDIVHLLLLTGCRKGEILNLRWDEVKGNMIRLSDSKTGARAVYLNEQAAAIINEQWRVNPEAAESVFVFPSPSCPEKPRSSVDPFWQEVRSKAGLDDVRLHDLRHTFASHAVMRGVPLPVVSRLLGHSRLSMTMRYAHVSNKLVEEAAEKIGTILAQYLMGETSGVGAVGVNLTSCKREKELSHE